MATASRLAESDSFGTEADWDVYVKQYEDLMTKFIFTYPHIPPTMFELKLHHNETKQELINKFCSNLNQLGTDGETVQMFCQELDNLLERAFIPVAIKNVNEYKLCQTGFIIGWKRENRPNPQIPVQHDDRF